jgi:DUF3053 family protein
MKFALRGLVLVLLSVLTGCNDEPAQRHAFIDFLQQHIIDRRGVHYVLLNDELRKSLGPYVAQYQIILDFNDKFELTPLQQVAGLKNEISDLGDFAAHRDELKKLRAAIPEMVAAADARLTAANATRAALQQPPDLKEVYDKAFDRLVTQPGTLLAKMLDLLPSSLDAMIALGDYVADNAKIIRVVGMDATSPDPVVERHVRELVEAMHKNDDAVADLKRQFQALLTGS